MKNKITSSTLDDIKISIMNCDRFEITVAHNGYTSQGDLQNIVSLWLSKMPPETRQRISAQFAAVTALAKPPKDFVNGTVFSGTIEGDRDGEGQSLLDGLALLFLKGFEDLDKVTLAYKGKTSRFKKTTPSPAHPRWLNTVPVNMLTHNSL